MHENVKMAYLIMMDGQDPLKSYDDAYEDWVKGYLCPDCMIPHDHKMIKLRQEMDEISKEWRRKFPRGGVIINRPRKVFR